MKSLRSAMLGLVLAVSAHPDPIDGYLARSIATTLCTTDTLQSI